MNRPRSRALRVLQVDPPGVWAIAECALRCEGVDPFGDRRLLSFRCNGINPGDRHLVRTWKTTDQRSKECVVVSTRHCEACAAVIDAPGLWVLGIVESAPARGGAALRP